MPEYRIVTINEKGASESYVLTLASEVKRALTKLIEAYQGITILDKENQYRFEITTKIVKVEE